jgi:hypothetical protein
VACLAAPELEIGAGVTLAFGVTKGPDILSGTDKAIARPPTAPGAGAERVHTEQSRQAIDQPSRSQGDVGNSLAIDRRRKGRYSSIAMTPALRKARI